jgi:hypothetical protein
MFSQGATAIDSSDERRKVAIRGAFNRIGVATLVVCRRTAQQWRVAGTPTLGVDCLAEAYCTIVVVVDQTSIWSCSTASKH